MSNLVFMLEPEPFGTLVGDWLAEANHPTPDAAVPGTFTFKWSR